MEAGLVDKRRAFIELVELGTLPDLAGQPTSWPKTEIIMDEYERQHPELIQLTRTKGTFFGARNVGAGRLDKYTKFLYLPAVKEAMDEIQGTRSAISELLNMIVIEKINQRDDLIQFRERINSEVLEQYSHENLGSLNTITDQLSSKLNLYAPGSKFILEWNPPIVPSLQLPTVSCLIFEDGFESGLNRKGHGLQRAVILTLIEQLAYYRALSLEGDQASPIRIDIILAIEEPEIYLHPNRCRHFSTILNELSQETRDEGSRTQIIYTTHSPYFVDLDRYDQIRLFRKETTIGLPVPSTNIYKYSLAECTQDFVAVCGPTYRNALENFRIRSIPIMTTIMNEGFFSDLIVLVEGQSDIGVLWKVQEILGKSWQTESISVLQTMGKGGLLRAKIIFEGFRIPTYVIFDTDLSANLQNRRLLTSLNILSGIFPHKKTNPKWAFNQGNMEEECVRMLSQDIFDEIWDELERELEIDDTRTRKNPEMVARFVKKVYERKLSLVHYERIVERIQALFSKHFNNFSFADFIPE